MPRLCGTRFRGRAPCERARHHPIVKKAGLLGRHRPRDEHRVEARIAPAQAPVEMGTGRAPGLADRADHLPLADVIAHRHVDARQAARITTPSAGATTGAPTGSATSVPE